MSYLRHLTYPSRNPSGSRISNLPGNSSSGLVVEKRFCLSQSAKLSIALVLPGKALSLFVTWMTPSYPQCQWGLLLSYQLSKTSEFLSLGHCRYWGVNSCLCLLWIPVPPTAAGTWQTKHHQEQPNFTPPLFSFLKRAELQNLNSVFQVRMVLCNAWFSLQNVAQHFAHIKIR